jgi:hypothetical protein
VHALAKNEAFDDLERLRRHGIYQVTTMSNFKCENCAKVCPEEERAPISVATKILFAVSQLILSGMFGWSFELCKKCVRQRYLLAVLVVAGVVVLFLFFR